MKVRLNVQQDSNRSPIHTLFIDDNEVAYIADLGECPEDAHIGRDLIDGLDIIKYIQIGYELGKKGEPLYIEHTAEEI